MSEKLSKVQRQSEVAAQKEDRTDATDAIESETAHSAVSSRKRRSRKGTSSSLKQDNSGVDIECKNTTIDCGSNSSVANLVMKEEINGPVQLVKFLQRLHIESLNRQIVLTSKSTLSLKQSDVNIRASVKSSITSAVVASSSASREAFSLGTSNVNRTSNTIEIVSIEWTCKVCTLINDDSQQLCGACGARNADHSGSAAGTMKSGSAKKPITPLASSKDKNKKLVPINKLKFGTQPSKTSLDAKQDVIVISDDDDDGSKNAVVATSTVAFTTEIAAASASKPKAPVLKPVEDVKPTSILTAHSAVSQEDVGVIEQSSPILIDFTDSSQSSNELSTRWADVIDPPKGWGHLIVELTGRRIGDKRKGKNLLIGETSILCTLFLFIKMLIYCIICRVGWRCGYCRRTRDAVLRLR